MEKISISQFDDVYHLFQRSFVLEELRPYEQMKKLFQQNLFSIYAKYDHNVSRIRNILSTTILSFV